MVKEVVTYQVIKNGRICKKELENIEFDLVYDVVVVGGGTAGSIAAIMLAKKNKKVLVIEQLSALGGVHTSMMFDYYMGASGGYYEELDEQIKHLEEKVQIVSTYGSHVFCRKCVYEQTFLENGGSIEFESTVCGVYMQDRTIIGLQYLKNGKLENVRCSRVIDSSSNAVVCRIGGVAATKGRDSDGHCQTFSNVRIYFDKLKKQIEINNIDSGYVNSEDLTHYSKAVMQSTQNHVYCTPSENTKIDLAFSPILGVRESYTIVGEKRVTLKGIVEGDFIKEPLFYSLANVDNHSKDIAFESEALCDWIVAMSLWGIKIYVGIPKEALIPKNINHLVVAGRHLSVDHDLASQMRMMRDCQKCGEAAAILVNESLNHQVSPLDVRYEWMIEDLKATHCFEPCNSKFQDNPPYGEMFMNKFPESDEEIKEALKSDRAGVGMLLAYQKGMKLKLKEWLKSRNENLKANSAIVLGLLEDHSGVDVLLQLVQDRDTYLPKTSKSYNTFRGISAIYVLGRLGERKAIPLLMDLLKKPKLMNTENIVFDKLVASKEDYCFQYISHCVRALLSIARKHEDLREAIGQALDQVTHDPSFKVQITLKSNIKDFYDMSSLLNEYIKYNREKQERRGKYHD